MSTKNIASGEAGEDDELAAVDVGHRGVDAWEMRLDLSLM
jgi:hypothetical protein